MEVIIRGGTFGDVATAAIVVNAIPRVLAASPGLMTMIDMPLVHAYSSQGLMKQPSTPKPRNQ